MMQRQAELDLMVARIISEHSGQTEHVYTDFVYAAGTSSAPPAASSCASCPGGTVTPAVSTCLWTAVHSRAGTGRARR